MRLSPWQPCYRDRNKDKTSASSVPNMAATLAGVVYSAFFLTTAASFSPVPIPQFNNYFHFDDVNRYNEGRGWSVKENQVIFDCDKGKIPAAKIWIMDKQFPSTMEKLTIQNCEDLEIIVCNSLTGARTLRILHVQNIGQLKVNGTSINDGEMYTDTTGVTCKCFAEIVKIENVNSIQFGRFDSYSYMNLLKNEIKVLKMKDVTLENVARAAIESKTTDRVEWVNVTVQKWEETWDDKTFRADGKTSTVTFENCALPDMTATFTKTIKTFSVTNSNFAGLDLNITAENFIFEGNTVRVLRQLAAVKGSRYRINNNDIGYWGSGTTIESTHVDITDNRIQSLGRGALHGIADNKHSYIEDSDSALKFVNNTIRRIATDSLDMNLQGTFHSVIFDRNGIDCSCRNINWFYYLTQVQKPKNHDVRQSVAYEQFLQADNYCLTDRKCPVRNVVDSFRKLCTGARLDDYCFSQRESESKPVSP